MLRLALMGARRPAVSPATGDSAAIAGARGDGRAVLPPPGGSGRYRPAVAHIGGERAAVVRRERGDAVAGWGGSGAIGPALGRRQRLDDVATSDSSTSTSC